MPSCTAHVRYWGKADIDRPLLTGDFKNPSAAKNFCKIFRVAPVRETLTHIVVSVAPNAEPPSISQAARAVKFVHGIKRCAPKPFGGTANSTRVLFQENFPSRQPAFRVTVLDADQGNGC